MNMNNWLQDIFDKHELELEFKFIDFEHAMQLINDEIEELHKNFNIYLSHEIFQCNQQKHI